MFFGVKKKKPFTEFVQVRVAPLKTKKEVLKEFKRITKGTCLKGLGKKYLEHTIRANSGFTGEGDCCRAGNLYFLCQEGEARKIFDAVKRSSSKILLHITFRDHQWCTHYAKQYMGASDASKVEYYLSQNYWEGHSFGK